MIEWIENHHSTQLGSSLDPDCHCLLIKSLKCTTTNRHTVFRCDDGMMNIIQSIKLVIKIGIISISNRKIRIKCGYQFDKPIVISRCSFKHYHSIKKANRVVGLFVLLNDTSTADSGSRRTAGLAGKVIRTLVHNDGLS